MQSPTSKAGLHIIGGRPFIPGRRRVALLAAGMHGIRLTHLLRYAAMEYDVVLFALTAGTAIGPEPLLEFCARVVLAEHPETMQDVWERLPREWAVEARQVDGVEMACYGGDLLTAESTPSGPRTWLDWRGRGVLRGFRRTAAIPNGVALDSNAPSLEPEGHRVCLDQIDRIWFVNSIWPRVLARIPEASLAPVPEEANVVVGPSLQAMAIGRAVIVTPQDAERLGLRHESNAWIARDAAAFARGIATLLADPAVRHKLALAARRIVEERFDWNQIGALERGLLHEILDRPASVRPARKADVPELDRIQRLSPEAVLWEPSGYLSYDCRVAELDGRVVGFVVCRSLSADEAEVLSLVVDPEVRRRGVGSRLMGDILRSNSSITWYLEVRESNWRARNLYKKLGFLDSALRPAYYQDTGEAAVVMRLKPC